MDNKDFKPYIPAEKITPEITITSIVMGVLLAVIFGAANAYLGLRVGMTVSASIPAAQKFYSGEQYCADHRFGRRVVGGRCHLYAAGPVFVGGGGQGG